MTLPSALIPTRHRRVEAIPTSPAADGIDLDYISNQAGAPDASSVDEVEAYHRALFLGRTASEFERTRQEAQIHGDRVERLETRLGEVRRQVASVEKLMPRQDSADESGVAVTPWTHWDRVMVTLAGVGVLGLLIFGVLNISFNLLESGLVTFQENPARAYFWAALLPVGAMAVKIGWDSLEAVRTRRLYHWTCLILGVAAVLVWVAAYASVYPSLSKNTAERIQSLSVFDGPDARPSGLGAVNGAGARWVDVTIVGSQAVAELFISAALGIYMTRVASRHTAPRLPSNPLHDQLEEERVELESDLARERLSLGAARGTQQRLEHQLNVLVALARSAFQREAALRRDQSRQERLLLDQIAGQLRTQLQTVGTGAGHPGPRLTAEAAATVTRIGNSHE